MVNNVPSFLNSMLLDEYGDDISKKIIEGYNCRRSVSLRVNTIKTNKENILKKFQEANIITKSVSWNNDALIIENADENEIRKLDIYENGEIYLQSLSAMIPAIELNPIENENILDMTAAPGGKTTQIAALSNNNALITACEKNKIRADRLSYNIKKQGANRVNILREDARNLDNLFSFDKILLDAPCSGSGTLNLKNENIEKYFTEELIERSKKVQASLLSKAIKILKSGNEMIYSTCSVLKEENEEIVKQILNKYNVQIVPIDLDKYKDIPLLPVTIKGTMCVCPSDLYEGFFIARIRKN